MSKRVAVCVSGRGSNLRALLETLPADGPARVALVISNRKDAGALDIARQRGVPVAVLAAVDDAEEWLRVLESARIDLIVLAGFLKRVPSAVVAAFRHRIMNIHPALLPDHGGPGMYGLNVHRAVLARSDRESGATVHEVTDEYDQGAILGHATVPVLSGDTPESLADRVLSVEHRLLPAAVLAAARAGRVVPFSLPPSRAPSVA